MLLVVGGPIYIAFLILATYVLAIIGHFVGPNTQLFLGIIVVWMIPVAPPFFLGVIILNEALWRLVYIDKLMGYPSFTVLNRVILWTEKRIIARTKEDRKQ